MRTANFKCPKTNKEFFFAKFKMVVENGKSVYKDKYTNKVLTNPENGEVLIHIPKKGVPVVFGSALERANHNSDFFKERAKKHANSDEQQALKKKRLKQEIKTVSGQK